MGGPRTGGEGLVTGAWAVRRGACECVHLCIVQAATGRCVAGT